MRSTISATPRALGCMPSVWFSSGRAATAQITWWGWRLGLGQSRGTHTKAVPSRNDEIISRYG